MREAFDIFDQNSSGYIESFELRNVLQAMGQNPTQKEIDSIIQEADFARIMKSYVFKNSTEIDNELLTAFQVFDRDKNGFISRQELEFVLKSIGEQLTTEEIDELFRSADANEDGKISYKEFVVLFSQPASAKGQKQQQT
uniref:EF-hand domain-containing protein n=2 Tax=Macrostomum lignano TaxID=282301 RepID=A0A1I8IYV5_9PLAT